MTVMQLISNRQWWTNPKSSMSIITWWVMRVVTDRNGTNQKQSSQKMGSRQVTVETRNVR